MQVDARQGEIDKAHKYIRRWMGANGKRRYAYPSGQKRGTTRTEAKRAIAAKTKLITGIKPLKVRPGADIDNAVNEMIRRCGKKGFLCPALGNRPVFVTRKTLRHIKATRGNKRTPENRRRKARYIPFIPELLKHGRISEKSRPKEGMVYGVIGQVEYFRNDGRKIREYVELAVAYDKAKKQFVLSFSEIPTKAGIKKALPKKGGLSGNFWACPIVDARPELVITLLDTVTVPITIYSISDDSEKNNRENKNLFQEHIAALLKTIGER